MTLDIVKTGKKVVIFMVRLWDGVVKNKAHMTVSYELNQKTFILMVWYGGHTRSLHFSGNRRIYNIVHADEQGEKRPGLGRFLRGVVYYLSCERSIPASANGSSELG